VHRANLNAAQVKVYERLIEVLEQRKIPKLGSSQVSSPRHVPLLEVEREFLEAFSLIISSSYYIEEEDLFALLDTL